MCPTGDQRDQIRLIFEKAQTEATLLQAGNLNATDTKHAIVSSIFPRLQWSLPCMSISHTESKKLLRPVLNAALPKMKIIKTLGYDYIHGSTACHGLGLPELYHSGYSKQLEMLVDHTWKRTDTGHFIQMALQEFTLDAGSQQEIFKPISRKTNLHHWLLTEHTWIKSLRHYTKTNDICVDLKTPKIENARIRDITIMDTLDIHSSLSSTELKDVNVCRIYKQVTLLSDIAVSDGSKLCEAAWTKHPFYRKSKFPYPHQDSPNNTQWKSWNKALIFIQQFLENNKLGEWVVPSNDYHVYWDYFYNPTHKLLLHRSINEEWNKFIPSIRTGTRRITFSNRPIIMHEPPTLDGFLRVTISEQNHIITIDKLPSHSTLRANNPDIVPPPHTSDDPIATLQHECKKFPDSKWALKNIEITPSITLLLSDFAKGKAVMVGDGSYDDVKGLGAGSCIVSSSDESEYIIASGPTPGPQTSQSAYRSEIGTIVAMGILSHALSHITASCPDIIIACDNDSALERPFLPLKQLSARQKSSDLLSLAHDLWKRSPASPIPTRVKGHRDDITTNLTKLERLNCIVDNKAKQALHSRDISTFNRQGDLSYGLPAIQIRGTNITGRVSQSIQEHQAIYRSKQAGIRHNQFTEDTWPLIDHRAMARAADAMTTSKKVFVTKWISQQLPVGTRMVQRSQRLDDKCPICQQLPEDMHHLTHCKSPESIRHYHSVLEKLSQWMQSVHTDPILQHHIIATLSCLRSQDDMRQLPFPCILSKRQHYQAFREQSSIGWTQFSQGLISSKWAQIQHSYYQSLGKRNNGLNWAAKLIVQLWEINYQVWTFRNNSLHNNQKFLRQLHGESHLNSSITLEFHQGLNILPTQLAPFFLYDNTTQLLDQSLDFRINWFQTIRSAREATQTDTKDGFSVNGALRSWAGLKKL